VGLVYTESTFFINKLKVMFIFESFYDYLNEGGGESAGLFDLTTTNIDVITNHAIEIFQNHGRDLYEEIPNFDKNILHAKSIFMYGKTKREEMPAIEDYQVKDFQRYLEKGSIDIHAPYYDDNNNPFPEGLTGKQAMEFLTNGLKDGDKTDDIIKVYKLNEKAKNLKPIQKQVYIDKNIRRIAEGGSKESRKFLQDTKVIASNDNYIIDGHHRFLTALLIDPDIKIGGVIIDLDINILKDLALAYGDAIGNKRNK
jgi:hypothetical protein